MTNKKIFIITLALVTAALSAAAFMISFRVSAKNQVREKVAAETLALSEGADEMLEANEALQTKISDIDADLSTKNTVNNYYLEYKKTHNSLTEEITELRKTSEELDTSIEQKRTELQGSSELTKGKTGSSYQLSKGETYSCPDAIPAGRYTASGSGSLTVINSSGRARLAQNLDVAYGNSYTFNLYEKEKIMVTGNVKITELK